MIGNRGRPKQGSGYSAVYWMNKPTAEQVCSGIHNDKEQQRKETGNKIINDKRGKASHKNGENVKGDLASLGPGKSLLSYTVDYTCSPEASSTLP